MMWIFSDFNPVIVKTEGPDLCLGPGAPHEVPEDVGKLVLTQAGDLVRKVQPVYWEDIAGHRHGPGVREYLGDEWDWCVITCDGQLWWVPSVQVKHMNVERQNTSWRISEQK